jgi:hypothetical protein
MALTRVFARLQMSVLVEGLVSNTRKPQRPKVTICLSKRSFLT